MKKNKGVSMIELVIVIVILIMIAAFAISSTKTTNLQAEATLLYTEMRALKAGVLSVKQDYDYGIIDTIDKDKYYNDVEGDWCKIYGIGELEYSEEIIKNLSLDELKRTYLVNYETGDIKLKESVTIGDYKIETYEDIEKIIKSGAI